MAAAQCAAVVPNDAVRVTSRMRDAREDCGEKSLRKTYKCQTEANEKVWFLDRDSEKALVPLENICERIEQVNGDLANVDTVRQGVRRDGGGVDSFTGSN